jgi:hypothetical protein
MLSDVSVSVNSFIDDLVGRDAKKPATAAKGDSHVIHFTYITFFVLTDLFAR